MRILITNNTMSDRAGSELYACDIALAFLRRGHAPVVFSTVHGTVADALRAHTVPVINDLAQLGEAPDIIHGQHHLETMIAATHFPHVPVINLCHGWMPWEEMPVHVPSVMRYVAVDETCRERLIAHHGIAPERIEVLLNFVDLSRFRPTASLREKPERALIFSNYAAEDTHLPPIREACARLGIALDVYGLRVGRVTQQPEALLAHYDVVFAKARAALEAMACGTAVIVCDAAGLAEMVTTDRMHALRRLNFGIRTLQRPVTVDAIAHELTRYDRDDAAKVAAFIRHDAGIDPVVDRLLQIYTESIANFPVPALRAMSRAASGYLRWLAPHVKTIGGLHQRLAQHEQEVAQHRHAVSARDQELQASAERVATLQQELQALETRLATADATARLRQSREQEVEHLQAALREIATSSTMQLRDRIVGLPLVGAAVRSLARSIARRRSH